MSAPSWTKQSGRGERSDRWPRRGPATDIGTDASARRTVADEVSARDRHTAVPMQPPIGTPADRHAGVSARRIGTDDRHEDAPTHRHGGPPRHGRADADADADADLVPIEHEIDVPVAGESGALVMRSRGAVSTQEAVSGLRFVNMPHGSLKDLLRFARTAPHNLAHLEPVRAMHVSFIWWVTAPILGITRPIQWAHVSLFRAVPIDGGVLLAAHYLNRNVDWLVPDWLDVGTWSATTWTWVAAWAFAYVLVTVIVYMRARWH